MSIVVYFLKAENINIFVFMDKLKQRVSNIAAPNV